MRTSSIVKFSVIIGLVILCLALYDHNGSLSKRSRELEEKADILAADGEILRAELSKQRTEAEAVIKKKDERIAALLATAGTPSPAEQEKDREISELKGKIAEYEANGDPVAALAEAKRTITALEVKFSLAEERHKGEIFSLNAAWEEKYLAQVSITNTWKEEAESWKRQYEGERALRLSIQRDFRYNKADRTASLIAEGGIGVYCVAKGDVLPLAAFASVEAGKMLFKFIRGAIK